MDAGRTLSDSRGPAPPDRLPSRMAVILFTDIVDSAKLKNRDGGTKAYGPRLLRHNQLFEELVARYSEATVPKHTGDGYLALFGRASDAVNCALCFNHAMRTENWGDIVLTSRVGIHVGEIAVVEMAGKLDVIGPSADLASRVMSLAQDGQILLTRQVFDDARQFIDRHPDCGTPLELKWVTHGAYEVKGLSGPVEITEVGAVGLAPLSEPPASDKAMPMSAGGLQSEQLREVTKAGRIEWARLRADFEAEAKKYPALTLTVYVFENGKPILDDKFGQSNHAVTLWRFSPDAALLARSMQLDPFGIRGTEINAFGVIVGRQTDHFVRMATRAGSLLTDAVDTRIFDNVTRIYRKSIAKPIFVMNRTHWQDGSIWSSWQMPCTTLGAYQRTPYPWTRSQLRLRRSTFCLGPE